MQGYVIRIGSSNNKNNFYDVVIQEKTTLDQIAIIATTILEEELAEDYRIELMDSVFCRDIEANADMAYSMPVVDSREVNVATIFDALVEYFNIANANSSIFVYFVNLTDAAKKYPEIINSNDRDFITKNQKLVNFEVGAGKLDAKQIAKVSAVLSQIDEELKTREFIHFTVIRIDDAFFVINNFRSLSIQIYANERDYILGHENCMPEQTPSLYKHCYYVSTMNGGFGGVKFNYGLGDSNLTNYDVSLIKYYLAKLAAMFEHESLVIPSKKPRGYYEYDSNQHTLSYKTALLLEELLAQRIALPRMSHRIAFARNRNIPQISIDLAYGLEAENIIMSISSPINTAVPIKGYTFDSLVGNIIATMSHYASIGYNFIKVKTDDRNLYDIINFAAASLNTEAIFEAGEETVLKVMTRKDGSEGSYYFNHYRKYEELLDDDFKDFLEYASSYKTANYLMSGQDKSGAVDEMERFLKKYK